MTVSLTVSALFDNTFPVGSGHMILNILLLSYSTEFFIRSSADYAVKVPVPCSLYVGLCRPIIKNHECI